jgi:hypothetical protein
MRSPAFHRPALSRRVPARGGALALALLLAGCAHLHHEAPAPAQRHVEVPNDNGLPPGAARALSQRFPTLRPLSHASGHLQVDDADDLAVVLAPPGQAHDGLVALLVTGAGGEYRVATTSRVVSPGCETCTTTVDIAHHVLSVHVARPSDPDFERVTYQFGYRETDDALRLTGVTAAQPAGDDPIAHGYAITANLLTGAKLDTLDPTATDPSRRRELRSKVSLRPAIAFDAFAFSPAALGPELRRQPAFAFEPADPLPTAVTTLLRNRFPGLAVQSRAGGALRAEGSRDLALVLVPADPKPADGGDTVVALLQAQQEGTWRLAAVSGPVTRNCRGCDVQALIAHRALVVQTTGVDSAGTHVAGYQFMPARDKTAALRLVGVRTVLATRAGNGDSQRYVNTANLATGDKLDVIEDVIHGRRTRTEHASRVPVRPAIAFAGFAFDPSKLDAETRRDFATP